MAERRNDFELVGQYENKGKGKRKWHVRGRSVRFCVYVNKGNLILQILHYVT